MALPEIIKDIEARVKDTGDTMTGLLKAHGGISLNDSTEQSRDPLYLLGIKAFADGGNVIWSSVSDVFVGTANNAYHDINGARIDLTYLKLAGGTMTGPIKNGTLTSTWVSACNGNAFINSTKGAGTFSPMLSGATSNGRMTLAFYENALQVAYITKANCDINNNDVAKVAKLFTESGGAEWPGLLVQGSPSTDSSISKMNRFQADLYVAGNGAAPNKPKEAGFYLGRSTDDENRHMDIVSGGQYGYIDFNQASAVEDYKFRILVDVQSGLVNFNWFEATTPQLSIHGGLAVTGATSISGPLTAGGNIYINNGGHGGIGLYNTSSPNTYGIHMSLTSSYGTHGFVTGDWATYFCFDGTNDRGWIFKHAGTNIASISGTGGAKFDNTVFGYAYTRSNNKAAFMWDKKGSNYTGVGANGVDDTIYFGACDINGSWVTTYQQIWKFNGALTLTTGDGINNASKNYISAGRGYSTASGKNGLKLICTEQTDAISGIGQDCTGKSYELSVGAALSTAGEGYITFVGHKMASLNSYAELGHFNFANSTFYVNGKIGVGHASPSYPLQVEGLSYTKGLLTCNRGTANSYGDTALEIREYNFGGAQSDIWGIAPRLSFHWSGRCAAQIGLASDGWLYAAPNVHNGGGMSKIVLENSGTWGIHVSGSATYLPCRYDGGDKPNPQQYFGQYIGLRSAMTRYAALTNDTTAWHDTLWINGYSGSDVPNLTAITTIRNGTPRMFLSSQAHTATSYGKYYEVMSAYNIPFVYSSDIDYIPSESRFKLTRGSSAWSSHVYSKDGYREGISVSYVIDQTSAYIMVGLNSDPTANSNYDSIDYCWYTQQGGGLNIYENGASVASIDGHTTYSAGDEFKVEYSGGYVKYYHNGVLCRIVNRYGNGAKLYMDSSFHNSGSISQVKVTPIINQSLPYFYRSTDISNYDTVNTPSYIATVGISGGNPVTATKPSGMDNAWGIIHMHTHAGNYATQLGFGGTTGNLYMRNAYNSTAFGGWRAILDSGNYTTYLNDVYVNATGDSMTGTLRLGAPYQATASSRFTSAALEIREAGRVGNAQSDIGYAPRIGFHWGGIVAASLVLHNNGIFYFRNQADTGQAPVCASVFYGALSGNADTATEARVLCTDATMKLYAQYSNEVNFGGTNASGTIYFGYRAVDSKPIPTSFIFGGATGTATVTASKFIGTLQGSATSSGYLTKKASYTTIAETDAFLEDNKVQWATVGANATSLNNDGIVVSYGWSATYGAQMFLDDGSGAANCYIRNRTASSWNPWRRLWASGDAVTSAVWNDYAECREAACEEPGYVLCEKGDDTLVKTSQRLSHFAGVSSDTWGFSQGETEKAKTPIAVAGRVLVYPYQDRNSYQPGDCVCAAPGGTVDIMTREEIIQYPDRIVGTVSCVPDYEEWGGGENADRDPVKVNGRIWIKVK